MKNLTFKLTTLSILTTTLTSFGMQHPMSLTAVAAPAVELAAHDAKAALADFHESKKEVAQAVESKQTAEIQAETQATVHVPKNIGATDTINLEDKEPFSQSTFKELITEQAKTGDDFLLARVVSQEMKTGTYFVHYYDAHSLNRHVMEQDYPYATITDPQKALIKFVTRQVQQLVDGVPLIVDGAPVTQDIQVLTPFADIKTKQPIVSIEYFSYNPAQPKAGFCFLFSYKQLMKPIKKMFIRLYTNQNTNIELKKQALDALVTIASALYDEKQYITACNYLIPIAQQQVDLVAKAVALYILGQIYYFGGHGIKKNFTTAHDYFKRAAEQDANPTAQAGALCGLGYIYYNGGDGIEKDVQRAIQYLEQALAKNADPEINHLSQKMLQHIHWKQSSEAQEAGAKENAEHKRAAEPQPGDKRKDHPEDDKSDESGEKDPKRQRTGQ